jgi:hypothetical protein
VAAGALESVAAGAGGSYFFACPGGAGVGSVAADALESVAADAGGPAFLAWPGGAADDGSEPDDEPEPEDDPLLDEDDPAPEDGPPPEDELPNDDPPDDDVFADEPAVPDDAPELGPDVSVDVETAGGPLPPPEESPGLAEAASVEARSARRSAAPSTNRTDRLTPGATDVPTGRSDRTPAQKPRFTAAAHGLDGPGRQFPPSPMLAYSSEHWPISMSIGRRNFRQ